MHPEAPRFLAPSSRRPWFRCRNSCRPAPRPLPHPPDTPHEVAVRTHREVLRRPRPSCRPPRSAGSRSGLAAVAARAHAVGSSWAGSLVEELPLHYDDLNQLGFLPRRQRQQRALHLQRLRPHRLRSARTKGGRGSTCPRRPAPCSTRPLRSCSQAAGHLLHHIHQIRSRSDTVQLPPKSLLVHPIHRLKQSHSAPPVHSAFMGLGNASRHVRLPASLGPDHDRNTIQWPNTAPGAWPIKVCTSTGTISPLTCIS